MACLFPVFSGRGTKYRMEDGGEIKARGRNGIDGSLIDTSGVGSQLCIPLDYRGGVLVLRIVDFMMKCAMIKSIRIDNRQRKDKI